MPILLPFNERLERAAQLILRSGIFLDLWLYFESQDTRPAIIDTMRCYNEFFRFTPHAHFVAYVVHMAALFEKRKETINLPLLTKEAKESALIPAQVAVEVGSLLSQVKPLAVKVTILRNNVFAHRNAAVSYDETFKRAAVTQVQLRELVETALQIVNKLLLTRGQSEHFFNELARKDADKMLKVLALAKDAD